MNTDLFGRPSTADTGARNDFDYYETPDWMTRSLLAHQPIDTLATILEPCVGDGAIARVLAGHGYARIVTNDFDPRHEATFHEDARDALWSLPELPAVDWVISNLPFTLALPIADQAWLAARVGVALLLRKTFTEPTGVEERPKPSDRGPWLSAHPPSRTICLPRHSFRGSGSDSVSTDWFIWLKNDRRELPPIVVDYQARRRTR